MKFWLKSDFQTLRVALGLLDLRDRKKYFAIGLIQIGMSFLDLFGVASIGALGALAVSGVQSKSTGQRVSTLLKLFRLDTFAFQEQVAILALFSSGILILRTCLSIYFSRRALFFLSRKSAQITNKLVKAVLSQPLSTITKNSPQEILFGMTYGVHSILVGVLGSTLIIMSDTSLLLVLFSGLLFLDPIIALSAIMIFGFIGFGIHILLSKKSVSLGTIQSKLEIESNTKILEALTAYREIVVRNKQQKISEEIADLRIKLAGAQAEAAFMPNISKYTIETTVVLGGLLLAATQFLLQDATHAVATLGVFLAAGSRIAPAVLRIQYGALAFKSSIGPSKITFSLLTNFNKVKFAEKSIISGKGGQEFIAEVELQKVDYKYPNSTTNTINDVNIRIPPGSFTAIVGPSGAGKTTLVDIILGLLTPSKGSVSISNRSPDEVFASWPDDVSYVPQEIAIFDTSIRNNIGFGFTAEEIDDEKVITAIKSAQLLDFVNTLPEGINTKIGEKGARLSGGQRQRLGIARALYTNPKLLILDEATSALDAETEALLSQSIHSLRGKVTVIMIAHRLSTVKEADQIIYLESGNILASGKFEEVRKQIPKFDAQAQLLGL